MNTVMNTATRTTRLVPALVLSVAVIGSATAGSAVAAKMITGADIKNGTVASVDVKNSSLTGKDLKTGSVGESDLGAGVRGKLNEPDLGGYEVKRVVAEADAGSLTSHFVACTPGKLAIGGGADLKNDEELVRVVDSAPYDFYDGVAQFAPPADDHADAWGVTVNNGLANLEQVTVYVVCVDPS
ncbi:MAG: hypothetical protein JWN84_60 [Nocardioides sp.]|nr:hypothetical protein [Nocardioides sp.]